MMWGSPQTTQSEPTHCGFPDRVVVVVVCLSTVVVADGTGGVAGGGAKIVTTAGTPANLKLRPPVLDVEVLITSKFNLHQDFAT
jgi:hypothetical protein